MVPNSSKSGKLTRPSESFTFWPLSRSLGESVLAACVAYVTITINIFTASSKIFPNAHSLDTHKCRKARRGKQVNLVATEPKVIVPSHEDFIKVTFLGFRIEMAFPFTTAHDRTEFTGQKGFFPFHPGTSTPINLNP